MFHAVNKYRAFFFFLVIFLIIFLLRVQTLYSLGDRDAGVFAYIGKRILEGDIPYRDIWDHKTPLIYYSYALLFRLFGINLKVLAYFEIFWLVVTSYALFKLARLWLATHAALGVAAIFSIYTGSTYLVGSYGMTETYALLPSILAVYFAYKYVLSKEIKLIFASGLMTTIAFLYRQTAGTIGLVIGLYLLILFWAQVVSLKQWIYQLKVYLIGLIIPIIALMIYFFSNNALDDFLSQGITYNLIYSEGISNALFYNLRILFFDLIYVVGRWPLLIALSFAGITFILQDLAKRYTDTRKKNEELFEISLIIWFLLDLFAIMYSGEFYKHYYVQMLASASLLCGVVHNRFFKDPMSRTRSLIVFAYLCIIATPLFTTLHANIRMIKDLSQLLNKEDVLHTPHGSFITDRKLYIDWIFENTLDSDSIYFWGAETKINFLTNRASPTRFSYTYPLHTEGYVTVNLVNQFLFDIKEDTPKYIIDTSRTNIKVKSFMSTDSPNILKPITAYIQSNYKYVDTVGEWDIYAFTS